VKKPNASNLQVLHSGCTNKITANSWPSSTETKIWSSFWTKFDILLICHHIPSYFCYLFLDNSHVGTHVPPYGLASRSFLTEMKCYSFPVTWRSNINLRMYTLSMEMTITLDRLSNMKTHVFSNDYRAHVTALYIHDLFVLSCISAATTDIRSWAPEMLHTSDISHITPTF
jgi:hypothetical protein